MKIIRGRAGAASERRSATFTGTVYADPVLSPADGVMINTVFFAPGARTYWHTHEHGQILHVTAGAGWIRAAGGPVEELRVGDVVWVPPGERHWHGGTATSFMVHVAISLGVTDWSEEVADDEYAAASAHLTANP